MGVSQNLLQAKQDLSNRLLRPAAGAAVARGFARSVSVAVASASAGSNIHAIGIGRKVVDSQATDTFAIRVFVSQKIALSLLPTASRIPETIDGIPTDVIESPPAFISAVGAAVGASSAQTCSNDRMKRQRPIIAGISAAHFDVTAGTISYFCRSTRPGDDPDSIYVLSNNHVFADVNQAPAGDDLFQPGPMDGGTAADRFAQLRRFANITLGGVVPNGVDAAIGELLPNTEFRARVCRIGKIRGTARATEDMVIRKHGRTTGYTRGKVTDESYDALVGMDHNDPNIVALFTNQMRIERISPYPAFALGGDSGSLVVSTPKAEAVGLYFAGPADGSYGIANHIADVLAALEIELL